MSDRPFDEMPADLPEWMRTAVTESLRTTVSTQPSLGSWRNSPEWPLFVDAAVVQSFLPRQLAAGSLQGESRAAAEKTLLQHAETVHDREGTKWALTRQARTDILNAALQDGPVGVSSAIERTAVEFNDPVSEALRNCLQSPSPPSLPEDLPSLEALRLARGMLNNVESVPKANIDELDRAVDLRRLLAPFERMIGETVSANGARRNQFFGRADEIETLRAYVGQVEAESFTANLTRFGAGVARRLLGVQPLAVWGVGGVGKTTLIAKFMLEHARAAESRFPFAYLDFDRPTISARNLSAIFIEICAQVAAQFPTMAGVMDELRDRAEEIRRFGGGTSELSDLLPCLHTFRTTLDHHFGREESLLESRPFLLVFDTFEVAQYDPESIGTLADFVAGFTPPNDASLWSRLRVIISGRQQVDEFAGPVQGLEIGALDREGSIEMLISLARAAGKPIDRPKAQRLIAEIVKVVQGRSNKGVDPLRLCLIGATFRETDAETGPQHVDSLIKELRKPISVSGISGRAWVDGLLVRRVLDHVKDRRVRALSDPGLVVRHITKDVIREVMTVATPDPAKVSQDVEDSTEFEPWRVSDLEAMNIFSAFQREVSLVEREGDALRHRQDVRRQMLPLIRARRPNRFRRINKLAFDFFKARAEKNPEDRASAAEAIYHGLWLGQENPRLFEILESLWRGPDFEPRIDIDEFATQPDAARFIRMKTGQRLSASDVQHLPVSGVRQWLIDRLPALLKESAPDRSLDVIRKIVGEDFEGLFDDAQAASVVARLLYRAGRWQEAHSLAWRFVRSGISWSSEKSLRTITPTKQKFSGVPRSYAEAVLSMSRTWTTISAKAALDLRDVPSVATTASNNTDDSVVRVELLAYGAIAAARSGRLQISDALLPTALSVPPAQWKQEWWILRLAILCQGQQGDRLAQTFIQSSNGFPRENQAIDAIRTLLELLDRYTGVARFDGWDMGRIRELLSDSNRDPSRFDQLDDLLRRQRKHLRDALVDSVRTNKSAEIIRAVQMISVCDHSDWHNVLANALTRTLKAEQSRDVLNVLTGREFLPRRRGASRPNGHAIVREAIAHGRFLELASTLADIPTHASEDAVAIARLLLHWHDALVALVNSSSKGPEQDAGQFSEKYR